MPSGHCDRAADHSKEGKTDEAVSFGAEEKLALWLQALQTFFSPGLRSPFSPE